MLRLWLGREFQLNSTVVTQCFAAALLLSGATYVPTALIQAAGRPDLSAKLVLFETPIYLPLAWFAVRRFGIDGAAIATVLRCAANVIFCFHFTMKVAPATGPELKRNGILVGAALCIVVLGAWLAGGIVVSTGFALGVLAFSAWAAWTLLLDQGERGVVLYRLQLLRDWI